MKITGSYTFSMDKQLASSWLRLFNDAAKPLIRDCPAVDSFYLLELLTEIDPTTATYSLQSKFEELIHYEQFDAEIFPKILLILNGKFHNQYAHFSTVLREV